MSIVSPSVYTAEPTLHHTYILGQNISVRNYFNKLEHQLLILVKGPKNPLKLSYKKLDSTNFLTFVSKRPCGLLRFGTHPFPRYLVLYKKYGFCKYLHLACVQTTNLALNPLQTCVLGQNIESFSK